MKNLLIVVIILMFLPGLTLAQEPYPNPYPYPIPNPFPSGEQHDHNTYTQPYKHDAYGPGIHSDNTGKPVEWETRDGQKSRGDVERNVFGPGIGMDEFGRPVKPSPLGQ